MWFLFFPLLVLKSRNRFLGQWKWREWGEDEEEGKRSIQVYPVFLDYKEAHQEFESSLQEFLLGVAISSFWSRDSIEQTWKISDPGRTALERERTPGLLYLLLLRKDKKSQTSMIKLPLWWPHQTWELHHIHSSVGQRWKLQPGVRAGI